MKLPLMADDLLEILPHRYPFLLIDRVTEFQDSVRAVGYKNVSFNEPFFQGHFPGRPLMPGVLIVEAMAQMGVIFAKKSKDGVPKDVLIVFSGAEEIRFKRQVVPGDCLKIEVEFLKRRLGLWKIKSVASVEGEVAATAILLASEVR